ncbi:MAG: hypothetical protein NTY22_01375 [Proteobacteria bacterium]|nr:hypothetical protein [Pseudomonadota bacterium]
MKTTVTALCFILSFNLSAESITDTIKKINQSTVAQEKITAATLVSWKDINKELMRIKEYYSCDLTLTDVSWSAANSRFDKSVMADLLMVVLMPNTSDSLINDLIGVFIHDDTVFLDMVIHNECARSNTGRLIGTVDEMLSANCSIKAFDDNSVISINDCTIQIPVVSAPIGAPYSGFGYYMDVKLKTVFVPSIF